MTTHFTFGIEFELNVATLSDDGNDPHPLDPRPAKGLFVERPTSAIDPELTPLSEWDEPLSVENETEYKILWVNIASKLREAGLPASADMGSILLKGGKRPVPYDTASTETKWKVKYDQSIHAPVLGGRKVEEYEWMDVEINSPAYYFCPESLTAVRLALETLTSNFRCNVNDSCGLHVHVGWGKRMVRLESVQNLMAFLWTFEPQINTLHPNSRVNSKYAQSLRLKSNLGKKGGERPPIHPKPLSPIRKVKLESPSSKSSSDDDRNKLQPPKILAAIETIYNTSILVKTFRYDEEDRIVYLQERLDGTNLYWLLDEAPFLAYRLINLRPLITEATAKERKGEHHGGDSDSESMSTTKIAIKSATGKVRLRGIKKTIEFRQHEGTLDPERAINWIETVVGLVHLADSTERGVWVDFLIEHARKEDHGEERVTLPGLFNLLGMTEKAAYYEARIEKTKADKKWQGTADENTQDSSCVFNMKDSSESDEFS